MALGYNVSNANSRLWLKLHIRQTTNISHLIWHSSYSHFVNKICLTFMESEIGFSLFYIAQEFLGGAQGSLNHIFFSVIIKLSHLKTWKWLQSIGFQQCKSSKVFFYRIRLARESVLLSAPIWSKGLWKKHKIMCNLPCEGLGLQRVGMGQCEWFHG